jgi:sec-independent protein translocase protein TatC
VTKTTAPDLDGRMPLMEHLVELRGRLVKCAVAVAIGGVAGFLLYLPLLDVLTNPLERLAENPNVSDQFQSFDPLEIFMLRLRMSIYLGIALAMPFLLWQLWQFVAPGLYQNERRYAGGFVVSATTLFVLGATIAYFVLPQALDFLQSMGGDNVQYQYTAENYINLILYMMLAFGIGFQFPIVLVFLQLVGVVTPEQLSSFRRFAIVMVWVAAAVITPSGDPISLAALAVPMMAFYEIAVLVGRVVRRRRVAAEAADG